MFDAQELYRFPGPDGKTIMHAEIKIGNSIIMLNDEMPQMNCNSPQSLGGTGSSIFLYVNDADTIFNKAVFGGAKPLMPLMDASGETDSAQFRIHLVTFGALQLVKKT